MALTQVDQGLLGTYAQYTGFKNRLFNGIFSVWQRGTSFSSFASGGNTYTADRFGSFVNGSGTIAVTQQAVTPTTFTALGATQDPQYYLQYQVSSLGTISYLDLNQRIEDVRTFAGQNMTVSFYAKADTSRTVSLSLYQNFGSGGSGDVAGSATNVTIGTSWAKYTVTLACNSISGKTIGAGSWVGLVFGLPVSTFTLSFALIQAEYGSTATSFDYRPYGTELQLCQRYFETWENIGVVGAWTPAALGAAQSTSQSNHTYFFKVNKRVSPTFSYSALSDFTVLFNGGVTASTLTALGQLYPNTNCSQLQATVSGTPFVAYQFSYVAAYSNNTTAKLSWSAEL